MPKTFEDFCEWCEASGCYTDDECARCPVCDEIVYKEDYNDPDDTWDFCPVCDADITID